MKGIMLVYNLDGFNKDFFKVIPTDEMEKTVKYLQFLKAKNITGFYFNTEVEKIEKIGGNKV